MNKTVDLPDPQPGLVWTNAEEIWLPLKNGYCLVILDTGISIGSSSVRDGDVCIGTVHPHALVEFLRRNAKRDMCPNPATEQVWEDVYGQIHLFLKCGKAINISNMMLWSDCGRLEENDICLGSIDPSHIAQWLREQTTITEPSRKGRAVSKPIRWEDYEAAVARAEEAEALAADLQSQLDEVKAWVKDMSHDYPIKAFLGDDNAEPSPDGKTWWAHCEKLGVMGDGDCEALAALSCIEGIILRLSVQLDEAKADAGKQISQLTKEIERMKAAGSRVVDGHAVIAADGFVRAETGRPPAMPHRKCKIIIFTDEGDADELPHGRTLLYDGDLNSLPDDLGEDDKQ